jgi:hypothetical protein
MDPAAFNYDASANTDDGSCSAVVNGCMDPTALNYDASANTDDGSCSAVVNGCMDPAALNYNASANTDDGSCIFLPANDNCATTEAIACGGSTTGSTSNATASGFGGSSYNGSDIWYSFTGTGDLITVSLLGSSFDTYLRVYDACGGTQVVFNDDADGLTSTVTFTSVLGTDYKISCGGYEALTGDVVISVTCVVLGCTDPTAFNYDASAIADDGSCVAVVTQFDFTASVQTFTVPAGVTSISVDAYGASGTTSIPGYGGNDYLGKGGRVQTNLTVTPGDVLNIYVGGTFNFTGSASQNNMGGWNGGGNEGAYGGFAGGGATDIRIGGTSLSDRVIVSGGGGGRKNSSSSANVGHGGGLVGQKGALVIEYPLETPGKGGTQSNGGQGGCDEGLCAAPGTLGSGSNGRSMSGNSSGGGGGGYYGGGGGASGGGGGGSSYTDPTLCSSVVHTQGAQTGSGQLTITIP